MTLRSYYSTVRITSSCSANTIVVPYGTAREGACGMRAACVVTGNGHAQVDIQSKAYKENGREAVPDASRYLWYVPWDHSVVGAKYGVCVALCVCFVILYLLYGYVRVFYHA